MKSLLTIVALCAALLCGASEAQAHGRNNGFFRGGFHHGHHHHGNNFRFQRFYAAPVYVAPIYTAPVYSAPFAADYGCGAAQFGYGSAFGAYPSLGFGYGGYVNNQFYRFHGNRFVRDRFGRGFRIGGY